MRNLQLSPIYAQEALNRAQQSILHALRAFQAKLLRVAEDEKLVYWSGIFSNSPILLLTLLFILSATVEVIFSMPMYLDLMSQMTGKANYTFALVGALLFIVWGGAVSHFIGKKLSLALYDYQVANKMQFGGTKALQAGVEEEITGTTLRDFIIGLFLGTALLALVAAISWWRVLLIGEINNNSDYSLIHKLLPVICVIVEIFSGIYLGYLFSRACCWYKQKKYKYRHDHEKEKCVYQTNMAAEYAHKADEMNQPVHYTKALKDALIRYQFRSIDDENYVDPIPAEKVLKVIVKDGQSLVQGVHLYGELEGQRYTGSIETNELGEAALLWSGDATMVIHLFANGELYKGPFLENTTAVIYLRKIKKIRAVND